MNRRPAAMAFSAAILLGTGLLFVAVPKGFLPSEDSSEIFGTTETVEGTSFDDLVSHQLQVMAVLQQDPNVVGTLSFLGGGGTINQGRVFMQLKPRSQRRVSVDDLIRYFNGKLAGIPGIQVFLQNPPPIQIGGRRTKSLYQFTLQSPDRVGLYDNATRLAAQLRKLPDLLNVTSDVQISSPQATVTINRDRAAALGITAEQVEEALYNAYGARQVSTIYTATNQYWVVMELLPQYQQDLSALTLLYIRSRTGTLVPLASIATLGSSVGPLTVNHAGQLPSVTISFDLRQGVAIGTAVTQVQRIAQQSLPSSITTSFAGTAQAFQSSQAGLLLLLILSVLVIYMVLGILYESFIHPLTILSALPFAAFGALLTLLIFRVDLSVYAFVGVIMLVGLVKKNGIMMIDFALEAQRTEGKSPRDAILQACSIRFRPIMMTTMAALMGTLPIALGVGTGSESRRPLGIAVVGGLAFSQLVTLYVTPVIYTYLDTLQQRLGKLSLMRAAPALSQGEWALVTLLSMLTALLLVLPVAWVYMVTKRRSGYDQSVVQTVIILPMTVAGTVILVQNSLALAFALAAIVAAVRFRNTLKDTKDAVYIFLALAVGVAAGVFAPTVAAVMSVVFNAVVLTLWQFNVGNIYADRLGGDRAARLEPHLAAADDKKKRFNGALLIHAARLEPARRVAEALLDERAKRWKLAEVVPTDGGTSTLEYLVRLKDEAVVATLVDTLKAQGAPDIVAAEFRSLRGLKREGKD